MTRTITLDTGALLALERRRPRMTDMYNAARERQTTRIVPQVVLAEWWRGRSDGCDKLLASSSSNP